MALHTVTPLLHSVQLSNLCEASVYLKLENTQPSSSFKIRGIGRLVQKSKAKGSKCVVSSSGGNAGMAAAYAARMEGMSATIIIPKSTPAMLVNRLQMEGATVEIHGDIWDEANKVALDKVAQEKESCYVHPFHHEEIWEGNSSLVDEVVEQCKATGQHLGAIVMSVGGGGLLAGVLRGLQRHNLAHVPVVAMETHGADCFNVALKAGKPVSIGNITSIAKTLGALQVTEEAFKLAQQMNVESFVVDDKQAVQACVHFLDDHRFLVEPSCGAALAAVYDGIMKTLVKSNKIDQNGVIVVVVCGGNCITPALLQDYVIAHK